MRRRLASGRANTQPAQHDYRHDRCAQYLIDAKITSPQKLATKAKAPGGIPAGGVPTQRPDLFAAVIDNVGVWVDQ